MYTLEFDTEIPKICIPIVGTKEEEIIKTAEDLVAAKVDLIEWRADYCSCILEDERLCLFLQKLTQHGVYTVTVYDTYYCRGW